MKSLNGLCETVVNLLQIVESSMQKAAIFDEIHVDHKNEVQGITDIGPYGF